MAFDPICTFLQIISCVLSFYLTLLVLTLPLPSMEVTDSKIGIISSILHLVSGFLMHYWFQIYIKRSKLVFDFSCTIVMVHFLLCSMDGLPNSKLFYITLILMLLLMVASGEHFCLQRELEPIPFGKKQWPLQQWLK